MIPVFITGTGTGIGKTLVAAMVTTALQADYWKPVQSGNMEGTDTELVSELIGRESKCFPELYSLAMPASPHIAARQENKLIDLNLIRDHYHSVIEKESSAGYLVIEGAGGLMVPLNQEEFVADLVLQLKARVILVSRNYLGSINHSLLTAAVCRQRGLEVAGWIFNDEYLYYQEEIAGWSGYPVIGSVPNLGHITRDTVYNHSRLLRPKLLELLQRKDP